MSQPSQKPGKSRQDFGTPDVFIAAVKSVFGHLDWDLAADETNHKAFEWFDEAMDGLKQPWYKLLPRNDGNWLWCNPPFGNIEPWARKCWEESDYGARVLMLVPASVGSNWWFRWVHDKAHVYLLSPRLCFDGKSPYPKDCVLLAYDKSRPTPPGYECWRWDLPMRPESSVLTSPTIRA